MIFFNASMVPEWILLVASAWFTALILNDVERGSIDVSQPSQPSSLALESS